MNQQYFIKKNNENVNVGYKYWYINLHKKIDFTANLLNDYYELQNSRNIAYILKSNPLKGMMSISDKFYKMYAIDFSRYQEVNHNRPRDGYPGRDVKQIALANK